MDDYTAIESTVKAFLKHYTEEVMLYNDIDLTIDTIAAKDILISTRADEQPYQFSSGTAVPIWV